MLFVCHRVCRRLKLHRVSDPLLTMDHLPGVSVVKPLMGVDPFLETNLESHFTLAYPKVRCHRQTNKKERKVESFIARHVNPSQSYRTSPVIWDHTVLPATRHR